MTYYRQVGEVPAKRHTAFRDDAGALRYEELMGEEGFSSDSSLLYHRGVPSAIVDSQVWELPDLAITPNHPLKPRHLRLHDLFGDRGGGLDPVEHRRLVLGNGDVRISYVVADSVSPYYRNAVGDECVYVEAGQRHRRDGVRRAVLPDRRLRLVPRATTHRWLPDAASRLLRHRGEQPHRAAEALPVPLRPVPRARAVLRARPARADRAAAGRGHRRRGAGQAPHLGAGIVGTRMTYATHPFDVVGWDGCLYP